MKLTRIIILLCVPLLVQSKEIDIVALRDLYYKATANKEDARLFHETTQNATGLGKPLLAGYSGMSFMIKANYVFNPYSKLSYFLKGKGLLDEAIIADPGSVELRFLRFCAQANAPGFLGYNGNMEEDKKRILAGFGQLKDADLKKRIRDYMAGSAHCSRQEYALLR